MCLKLNFNISLQDAKCNFLHNFFKNYFIPNLLPCSEVLQMLIILQHLKTLS